MTRGYLKQDVSVQNVKVLRRKYEEVLGSEKLYKGGGGMVELEKTVIIP